MPITLNQITAKFPGRCAASGEEFAVGATVLHDPSTRRCFLPAHAPAGALVTVPVAGAKSAAYRAGWEAGAPDAPMASNPHPPGSPEARMWTDGLRDRHRTDS